MSEEGVTMESGWEEAALLALKPEEEAYRKAGASRCWKRQGENLLGPLQGTQP